MIDVVKDLCDGESQSLSHHVSEVCERGITLLTN